MTLLTISRYFLVLFWSKNASASSSIKNGVFRTLFIAKKRDKVAMVFSPPDNYPSVSKTKVFRAGVGLYIKPPKKGC